MLQITINGKPVQIGQSLPETITHFDVVYPVFPPIIVPKQQEQPIRDWLLSALDRTTCEYITINNTYINTSELKSERS